MNNTRNKYVYLSCPLKYKVKQVIYVILNLSKVRGAGGGKRLWHSAKKQLEVETYVEVAE